MSRAPRTSDTFPQGSGSSRNPKEERKLSRVELLELLVQLSSENDSLKKENAQLRKQLEDRSIVLVEAGSIAEASLRLNGVFEAAQRAADDYLRNVKRLSSPSGFTAPAPASEAAVPPVRRGSEMGGRHAKKVL